MLPVSSYFRPILFLLLPFLCWKKCVLTMQYWSWISFLPLPECSVQAWVYCSESHEFFSVYLLCTWHFKVVCIGQIYEKFLQGKQTHVLCQISLPQSKASQRKTWNNKMLYKYFVFSLIFGRDWAFLVENVWKQFGQTIPNSVNFSPSNQSLLQLEVDDNVILVLGKVTGKETCVFKIFCYWSWQQLQFGFSP